MKHFSKTMPKNTIPSVLHKARKENAILLKAKSIWEIVEKLKSADTNLCILISSVIAYSILQTLFKFTAIKQKNKIPLLL